MLWIDAGGKQGHVMTDMKKQMILKRLKTKVFSNFLLCCVEPYFGLSRSNDVIGKLSTRGRAEGGKAGRDWTG